MVLQHPRTSFLALGFVLGAAPWVCLPVRAIPLLYPLAVLCWGTLVVGRFACIGPAGPTAQRLVLILVSAFSFIGHAPSHAAEQEFLRWALLSSLVYPLCSLGLPLLASVGRAYVAGAVLAAAGGLLLLRLDPHGDRLSSLSFLGYDPNGGNQRVVLNATGGRLRLTSSYVDPNLAGLMLSAALVLGLVLLRRRWAILCTSVLALAIAFTLSRAALAWLVTGACLLVVASRIPRPLRRNLALSGAVAVVAILCLGQVRDRLSSSFGSNDTGSQARLEALRHFPSAMSGHWLLGRGWGLPELVSGQAAQVTNNVANSRC